MARNYDRGNGEHKLDVSGAFDGHVGLALARPERQGNVSRPHRDVFPSVARRVRAKTTIENQGPQLLAAALEALSIAAFVCDSEGIVRALTPSAEVLIGVNRSLQLKRGRLKATLRGDTQSLTAAIELAAAGLPRSRPPATTVAMRNARAGEPPLVLDIMPLPLQRCELTSSARLLIVVRDTRNANPRKAAVLQNVYGLTAAETEIALLLAQGRSASSIAASRSVALATVRNQIKAIFAKTSVTRQGELVARIAQL